MDYTEKLYDMIGGKETITSVVDIFYRNILEDNRVSHFFTDIDMERLKEHQRKFLIFAFGGSGMYPKNYLRNTHKHLVRDHGLNESHFDAIAENLDAALTEQGISETHKKMILVLVGSVKEDVLGL